MDHLVLGLKTLRQKVPSIDWEAFCRTECVSHPVRFKVHQDPLTERAFFKPRGYPGDAVLLDLFLGAEGVQPYIDDATDLGQQIYRYTSSATAARALRRRKEILASFIDRVSDSTEPAYIMTLGCGHLREAELSSALKHRRVARFLAVDRDPDSLRVVREKFGPLGVETAESTCQRADRDRPPARHLRPRLRRRPLRPPEPLGGHAPHRGPLPDHPARRAAARDQLRARHPRRGLPGSLHGLAPQLPQRRGHVLAHLDSARGARWRTAAPSRKRAAGIVFLAVRRRWRAALPPFYAAPAPAPTILDLFIRPARVYSPERLRLVLILLTPGHPARGDRGVRSSSTTTCASG